MEEKGISTKINLEDLTLFQIILNIREKYEEFEGSMKGVDIQMLVNQVPGGMSNLETQLKGLGKVNLLEDVVSEIYNVRKDLGFVPLVTPASQIIGAQVYQTLSIKI